MEKILKHYELIVVGGGISGSIAAIAAARKGIKTLVIEQHGFSGGMLTGSGVGPMMSFHVGDQQTVQGITGELIDRMVQKKKSPGHIFDTTGYTYSVTPFDAEGMKHELELMLTESGGHILYHTMLGKANTGKNEIKSIVVCNKAGLTEMSADVFIDATGDADLSVWAGVEFTKGRPVDGANQPMTMNIKVRNVDIGRVKQFIKNNPDEFPRIRQDLNIVDSAPRLSIGGFVVSMKDAQQKGEISFKVEELLFFETNNPGEVIINTSRVLGVDGTEPWSLSRAEIEGRKQVRELERFLINRIPGFENAVVAYSGPNIGVRSSRQIKGVYTLTFEDIVSCKKFEDAIAHAGYPVDIHSVDGEHEETVVGAHLEKGSMYSVPYRCLVNPGIHNLITVGRCISATFEAQGAIRVTPTAGAIGHAGGVAAALSIHNGRSPADINIADLHSVLREQGAYIIT